MGLSDMTNLKNVEMANSACDIPNAKPIST